MSRYFSTWSKFPLPFFLPQPQLLLAVIILIQPSPSTSPTSLSLGPPSSISVLWSYFLYFFSVLSTERRKKRDSTCTPSIYRTKILLSDLKKPEGECVTHLFVLGTCITSKARGLLVSSITWKDTDN